MNHKTAMPPRFVQLRGGPVFLGTFGRRAHNDGRRSAAPDPRGLEARCQETSFARRKMRSERYSHECPIKGLTSGRGER